MSNPTPQAALPVEERDYGDYGERVADVLDLVEVEDQAALRRAVAEEFHPSEVAPLLESLPPPARSLVWEVLDDAQRAEALIELHDEVRGALIETTAPEVLVAVAQALDVDDLVPLLEDFPEPAAREVLQQLTPQERVQLDTLLTYPEDSAGRSMRSDEIRLAPTLTAAATLALLRRHGPLPDYTDKLMVVDGEQRLLGVLALGDLVAAAGKTAITDLMATDAGRVLATTALPTVADSFERRDLVSAPVVDDGGRLLGRITLYEVMDYIHQEGEHAFMARAGLDDEEDLFAPVFKSARRRGLWLGINLATAFLAAGVIGLFEATLEQVVALAVLMPIVASMGGIAGSQTLTLTIRGLALGQIGVGNTHWLARKELAVGVLNGLIWALVVAVGGVVWFRDANLGVVIALAMVINQFAAALAGVFVPLTLHRLKLDPALSGSVVLTTVTDVVGFMSFLGIGSWLLL
ncbi:MAG: magnesium transporter [Candidatus Competibacterales bacterium]